MKRCNNCNCPLPEGQKSSWAWYNEYCELCAEQESAEHDAEIEDYEEQRLLAFKAGYRGDRIDEVLDTIIFSKSKPAIRRITGLCV